MSRPHTPGTGVGSVPSVNDAHASRGYGSGVNDFAQGNPSAQYSSPLSQSMQHQGSALHDDADGGDSAFNDAASQGLGRSTSTASTAVQAQAPSRNNTLKKRGSVKRTGSLKRSNSRKSLTAGSIKGVQHGGEEDDDFNSAFYTPIPTSGSPTEILANRFQAWRQLLKSLIAYFREIQSSYDMRAKALHKVQNTITNIAHPTIFMSSEGLGDATRMLQDYHKRSISEANKSREIENDVIGALTGLRSDLSQKIKEIKGLSGDFKNSVDRERDATRKEVAKLQDALLHVDHEGGGATGKNDPYIVRLGVDRMIEKQIDEENYLHRAYLNLESSGRELESIVVGEIQKAYNALAGILKREGDDAYNIVENLRTGPISIGKDQEWLAFVESDPHFVNPRTPLRRIEDITYPGKDNPAATEVRSGMLERKSKYLKSYTPGWYVLSPTHLHEFKSADKIYSQPPVMSLYLPDQKLGSHSQEGSSSNKFMLKGRQTGGMHKGHSWVFRAESHDTMLAWFGDIRVLTEKSGPEREAFIRKHARSVSGGNRERARSVSSDGMEDDEADQAPYAADVTSLAEQYPPEPKQQRPSPGGRFPSDLNIPARDRAMTSSTDSEDNGAIAAVGAMPGSHQRGDSGTDNPYRLPGVQSEYGTDTAGTAVLTPADSYFGGEAQQPRQANTSSLSPIPQGNPSNSTSSAAQPATYQPSGSQTQQPFLGNDATGQARPNSQYGDWMAPAVAGVAGVGAGVAGGEAFRHHRDKEIPEEQDASQQHRQQGSTTVPIVAGATANAARDNTHAVSPVTTNAVHTNNVTSPTSTLSGDSGLGGMEAAGARPTGEFFPAVVRHNTDMSVSALHVPGEFPKQMGA